MAPGLQAHALVDAEAQCKVGWVYYMDGNYTEAAKWLRKAADQGNVNSMGAAGMLFVEGRGVRKDLKRGIRYLRRGAECPNIGGNENCAPDLAAMFEDGTLVPRDDAEAYYFLGICIAKCVDWDGLERAPEWDGLERRPEFVARQRAVARRLTPARKQEQDNRLARWLDLIKAGLAWRSMGELDSDAAANVSVYLDSETEADLTTATGPATLRSVFGIPLAQLGGKLQELKVSEAAIIRIYSSLELSPDLRAKLAASLVNKRVRYSHYDFVPRETGDNAGEARAQRTRHGSQIRAIPEWTCYELTQGARPNDEARGQPHVPRPASLACSSSSVSSVRRTRTP